MINKDFKEYFLMNFDVDEVFEEGSNLLDLNNFTLLTFYNYYQNIPYDKEIYDVIKNNSKETPCFSALYTNTVKIMAKYPYTKLNATQQKSIKDLFLFLNAQKRYAVNLMSRKNLLIRFDHILEQILLESIDFSSSSIKDAMLEEMASAQHLPPMKEFFGAKAKDAENDTLSR